ncbi:hypothetical protein DM02DRAFT_664110 [Periconia macrospinosa]|uniref:Uncharacterized protein n=1 Tax=Periconia macrospinosa TaxID=97972 RepID=A0A2V1CZX0_9PLEO|nr:hypothetical protein DM02DRAFT_664110 [Periconia macrospinosa]
MENTSTALKLAIPRLKKDDKFPRKNQRQSRTQRACNNLTGIARAIEKNNDLIDLLKNLSMHVDDVGKRMIDEQLARLRENDHTSASATELEAETLDASAKQLRKRQLSDESNQAHSPPKPDASESVNDYASSTNLWPDSSFCFLLPVQYPTQEMGTVRMQNLRAFQAQQQFQSFGNPIFN